ncbi:MAG: SDR family NAD(P)-dependent oxidoreductase, partial [Opitutaceae bacterium]
RHWVTPWATPAPATPRALRLTADDPILRDHEVQGRPLLPGAASLALARAELARALGADQVELRDIAWLAPLAPDAAGLQLSPEFTSSGEGSGRLRLRAPGGGEAMSVRGDRAESSAEQPLPVELAAGRRRAARAVDPPALYAGLAAVGFRHGPALRVVREIGVGEGELWARLELGAAPAGLTRETALVDGAFQALAALGDAGGAGLPFAARSHRVHREPPETVFVHARAVEGRWNIVWCDEAGAMVAEMAGLAVRAARAPAAEDRLTFHVPRWAPVPAGAPPAGGTRVLLLGADPAQVEAWRAAAPGIELECGPAPTAAEPTSAELATLTARLTAAALDVVGLVAPAGVAEPWAGGLGALHTVVRALAARERPAPVTLVFLHDGAAPRRAVEAYAAAVRAEEPWLRLRTVDCAAGVPAAAVVAEWRYGPPAVRLGVGGERARRELAAVAVAPAAGSPFRRGGTYVIAGGAGGLGVLLAEYLVGACGARVVLAGRNEPAGERRARLAALGDAVRFVRADLTEPARAAEVCAVARATFGPIDGVIHAAGVLRDGRARGLGEGDFAAVIAPKVAVAAALAAALAPEPEAFLLLLSSTAGVLGPPGQAAYAYANALLAAWAADHEAARAAGGPGPRVVTINLPLWADGGMGGPAAAARCAELGLDVLDRTTGLAVLERVLAAGLPRVMALAGDPARIAGLVRPPGPDTPPAPVPAEPRRESAAPEAGPA